jgi:hypothetical protein
MGLAGTQCAAMVMKNSNGKDVAEYVGTVAIVASLIFVGLKIRQEQVLARAPLGSATFDYMRSVRQIFNSTVFAGTCVRMLESPEELTLEEMVRIDSFLHEVVQMVARDCYLVGLGVFVDCTSILNRFVPANFSNDHAKSWWIESKALYRTGLSERLSSIIEREDPDKSRQYLERPTEGL